MHPELLLLPFLVIKNCFSCGKYGFLLLGSPDSLLCKVENSTKSTTNEKKDLLILSFRNCHNSYECMNDFNVSKSTPKVPKDPNPLLQGQSSYLIGNPSERYNFEAKKSSFWLK